MNITPLQFILIVASFIFILFAIDAYQRKKLNFLHFFVFFGGTFVILIFTLDVGLLNKFGAFFGIARGADLLVYMSIILLGYFYFELFNKINKSSTLLSKVISHSAVVEFDIKNFKTPENKTFDDEILFLIRARNEDKMIGNVIDEIFEAGYNKILVVNDGSKDDTAGVVEQKQEQYKDKTLILISHFINRGGGAANKTGFEFIRRYHKRLNITWFATFDADGQMDLKDMPKFIEGIKSKKYDLLIGSRFVKGGEALNMPLARRIILFGSKIITYIFNGLWVSDPHNGYRVISVDAIKKINIESDGMTYASELLDEVNMLGLKFKEIPVTVRYTASVNDKKTLMQ